MATRKKTKQETAGVEQASASVQPGRGGEEKEAVSKKKKHFHVTVYRAWCKRCGICVSFCPVKALWQDEETSHVIADNDKCIGCRRCERHCPDFSIIITVDQTRQMDQGPGKSEKVDSK